MLPIYALCLNNNSNKQTSVEVASFEAQAASSLLSLMNQFHPLPILKTSLS